MKHSAYHEKLDESCMKALLSIDMVGCDSYGRIRSSWSDRPSHGQMSHPVVRETVKASCSPCRTQVLVPSMQGISLERESIHCEDVTQ